MIKWTKGKELAYLSALIIGLTVIFSGFFFLFNSFCFQCYVWLSHFLKG